MLGLKLNLVFPTGKFTIRNKENGLFLSVVDGALAFTEVKDTNSDWFLVDGNEEWGTIRNYDLGKVLNMKDCGIDSCPVGLYSNNLWNGYGYLTAYQRWRRSGDKIVGALPGYLALDNSGNLVVIKSETDGNKDWIKLEIGNILTELKHFLATYSDIEDNIENESLWEEGDPNCQCLPTGGG